MTISADYAVIESKNAGEKRYPVLLDSHGAGGLAVYKVTDAARLLLTEGYHYWVDVGGQEGPLYARCDVVLFAPLAPGATLAVLRKTAIETDFEAKPLKPMPTQALEYTMDRACLIQQEIEGHACDCRGALYSGTPEIED